MAVGAKLYKKPNVVVEEFESENSDDAEEDSEEEPGDDMVEIKEEVEDTDEFLSADEYLSGDQGVMNDSAEIKSEDEDIQEVDEYSAADLEEVEEMKEEDSDEEVTSDDMGDDSEGEDSENESPKSKKKVLKQKEEICVATTAESSDESDTESESDDDDDEKPEVKEESDTEDAKTGLATVMAQILGTTGGSGVMLSKAKKDHEVVSKEASTGEFEFVDAEGNVKTEVKIQVKDEEDEEEKLRIKLRQKEEVMKKLKLKPNFEKDREKERKLRIIATQGVVQLFSAMEKHKAVVRKDRSETKSLVAREEISSSALKSQFLDILEEEGRKMEKPRQGKKFKRETKTERIDLPSANKKPKWSVFADNFYKEPTLQGWDQKSDEDD